MVKTENPTEMALAIINERTPRAEDVIYGLTVRFLDPTCQLTREERAKVVALGDRTAISYELLSQKVIAERGKTVVVEDEQVSTTAAFFLQYALSARTSREIAHTSIAEQLNPGQGEFGGDSPIVISGLSVLSALVHLASDSFAGFEALSSRGAVFPPDFWRIDPELVSAGIGQELNALNRDIYADYRRLLLQGTEHYLKSLERREKEPLWKFKWRALSCALDDARQVTNLSFLSQLSYHPNSALALSQTVIRLASYELPETQLLADRLRELGRMGLPTLLKYTEASEYTAALPSRKQALRERLGIGEGTSRKGTVQQTHLTRFEITPDPERKIVARFLASEGGLTRQEVTRLVSRMGETDVRQTILEIGSGMGMHDRIPEEVSEAMAKVGVETSVGGLIDSLRHRMLRHTYSAFSINRGFTMPEVYGRLGLEKDYLHAIRLTEKAYGLVEGLGPKYKRVFGPQFVSRAHLVDYEFSGPLSYIFHYIRVRDSSSAHPDVSGPARELKNIIAKRHPGLVDAFLK